MEGCVDSPSPCASSRSPIPGLQNERVVSGSPAAPRGSCSPSEYLPSPCDSSPSPVSGIQDVQSTWEPAALAAVPMFIQVPAQVSSPATLNLSDDGGVYCEHWAAPRGGDDSYNYCPAPPPRTAPASHPPNPPPRSAPPSLQSNNPRQDRPLPFANGADEEEAAWDGVVGGYWTRRGSRYHLV